METQDVIDQVDELASTIDELEDVLNPLLSQALSTSTCKLPLLDKAKLYVLATYAIDSMLFSALRLHGADAKSHPVFQELNRVKEYFAKIKSAETAGIKPNTKLDKDAAARFIKAGLTGNDRYDAEKRERSEREKAGAKRKLEDMSVGTHTRFDGAAKRIKAVERGDAGGALHNDGDHPYAATNAEATGEKQDRSGALTKEQKKEMKRQRRREARLARLSPAETDEVEGHTQPNEPEVIGAQLQQATNETGPKSGHETFEALLKEPLLPKTEEQGPRRKKRKG